MLLKASLLEAFQWTVNDCGLRTEMRGEKCSWSIGANGREDWIDQEAMYGTNGSRKELGTYLGT